MKYDLIIFDLDGTILNTLEDLAAAANHALAEAGYPARTTEEIRRFIGNGVANLIRRAVPEDTDEAVWQAILVNFKAYYTAHVNDRTVPYPGIPELLRSLCEAGIHVAVNSNKVDNAVQLLCAAHFDGMLELALGEREGIPKKPAPDGANYIMRVLGAEPGRTLYIGDGDADLLTARNAGIDCAWVSWGYRGREELAGLDIPHAFDTVDALRAFLLE